MSASAGRSPRPRRAERTASNEASHPAQDHRAIKRRVKAKQGFREFQAARRTIQGYETMHMIQKGQARWVSGSDIRRQIHFINKLFEVAA